MTQREGKGEGESQREGEGEGETSAGLTTSASGGATACEMSRYYSRPPDWALTLCVT